MQGAQRAQGERLDGERVCTRPPQGPEQKWAAVSETLGGFFLALGLSLLLPSFTGHGASRLVTRPPPAVVSAPRGSRVLRTPRLLFSLQLGSLAGPCASSRWVSGVSLVADSLPCWP